MAGFCGGLAHQPRDAIGSFHATMPRNSASCLSRQQQLAERQGYRCSARQRWSERGMSPPAGLQNCNSRRVGGGGPTSGAGHRNLHALNPRPGTQGRKWCKSEQHWLLPVKFLPVMSGAANVYACAVRVERKFPSWTASPCRARQKELRRCSSRH